MWPAERFAIKLLLVAAGISAGTKTGTVQAGRHCQLAVAARSPQRRFNFGVSEQQGASKEAPTQRNLRLGVEPQGVT
jgi:hypothetical protein